MAEPVRVTHLITSLDQGGAEASLAKLLASMDPGAFSHRVICLLPPGVVAEDVRRAGAPVDSLRLSRGVVAPLGMPRLLRLLRAERPHVLQTWLYHADFLGLVAGGMLRIPVAWNIRCSDMDLSRYSRLTRMVVRSLALLSSRPGAVATNSRKAVEVHQGLGYADRDYEIIPGGFDTGRYRPDPEARAAVRAELGAADDDVLVGWIGRDDPMKDLPCLAAAFNRAAASNPRLRLVLAGSGLGPDDPAINLFQDNASRCSFLGPRRDVERILAGLDAFALSSRSEGLPNVVGEAMAAELPCAVTDAGDTARLVGDTGRVAPVGDAEALGDALASLAALPADERAALGRAARQRIIDRYSIQAMVDAYAALYRRLAGR